MRVEITLPLIVDMFTNGNTIHVSVKSEIGPNHRLVGARVRSDHILELVLEDYNELPHEITITDLRDGDHEGQDHT